MHALEPASTGRSTCRACRTRITKGALRFGERGLNPYGEGESTFWFHPACAAFKRPEAFSSLQEDEELAALVEPMHRDRARAGVASPRLARLSGGQRAKSGRARCRACRERIEKDAWRVAIDIWEEGRFAPLGWLHAGCVLQYAQVQAIGDVVDRVLHFTAGDVDAADLRAVLSAATPAELG
ncbi:MAG: PARP-type zinc finger-containing protein [Myxococcota bacterium]